MNESGGENNGNGVVGVDVNVFVDGAAGVGVNGVVDGVVDGVGVGINGVFNNGVVNDVIEVGIYKNQEIMLDQTPPIGDMLNQTPPIGDVDTPNITLSSDGSRSDTSLCGSDIDSQSSQK